MRADVDTTRLLISGTSRGGILSVAYVARRPEVYLGAINFVGGWLGEGCGDFETVNRQLFVGGAAFPGTSLWIYAENDSFYSLAHSRSNYDAFSQAGGVGDFAVLRRDAGRNGHFIINDTDRWGVTVDAYVDGL
jgi:predicted peptidase